MASASGRLAALLGALDGALGAVESGMGDAWKETAVAVITEFGRTARINGTQGTDHGTATVALLAGGAEGKVRDRIVARSIETARSRVPPQPFGVPYELIVTHSVSATLGLLAWWLEHGKEISPEVMGTVVDRLVMGPVRAVELR